MRASGLFLDAGLTVNSFSEIREKREKEAAHCRKAPSWIVSAASSARAASVFSARSTGTRELGLFERGVGTQIDLYDEQPVRNAYSGNWSTSAPWEPSRIPKSVQDPALVPEARPTVCPLCSRGCAMWARLPPRLRPPSPARPHLPLPPAPQSRCQRPLDLRFGRLRGRWLWKPTG